MVEEERRVGEGNTPLGLRHVDVWGSKAAKECMNSVSTLARASQAVSVEMLSVQALTRATLPDAALLQL